MVNISGQSYPFDLISSMSYGRSEQLAAQTLRPPTFTLHLSSTSISSRFIISKPLHKNTLKRSQLISIGRSGIPRAWKRKHSPQFIGHDCSSPALAMAKSTLACICNMESPGKHSVKRRLTSTTRLHDNTA